MAKFTPRTYQAEIIRKGINEPYIGAFLDMGLGKTAIALTVIEHLAYREMEVNKVLIVAPKTVVQGVWQDEADKWEHTRKIRITEVLGTAKQREKALRSPGVVYAINYENLAWLCGYYNHALDKVFDMVIFDESSKMKSPSSVRFKVSKKAMEYVSRIMLLTGTPAPNGYMDLWSQVFLLDRGERLGENITAYRKKYFTAHRDFGQYIKYELIPTADRVIEQRISDICVSLNAADCLKELPEIVYIDKRIELSPKTYAAYKEFERRKVIEIADALAIRKAEDLDVISPQIVAANASALRGKLLQFSNGAVYLGTDALGREREGYTVFHDEKIDYLLDVIDAANGRPVLCTYTFRHDLDRLTEALTREGINVRQYKDVKDKNDWNAGKIEVLLVHPASAGYGLNLQQGGSIITWFGLTDNLEHYQQLNKRLHRSGQRETVRCIRLMVKGTEDEKVIKNLVGKDKTQAALMDSLKAKFNEYL
ncbi:DEAD/DEAH box helicase [Bacteroides fragilis]|nr:DEAD/DEAH box helicase [Bacteroides fragilis]